MEHVPCALRQLDDWVFISHEPTERKPSQMIAKARMHLQNKDLLACIVLLDKVFWDKERPPRSRDIQCVHWNQRNWILLPFLPCKYRNPMVRPWGQRLVKLLQDRGLLRLYRKSAICTICHQQ